MTNIAQNAVNNLRLVVWDGTNGDDVIETAQEIAPEGNWVPVSESPTQLVVKGIGAWGWQEQELAVGDALLFLGSYFDRLVSVSQILIMYRVEPLIQVEP